MLAKAADKQVSVLFLEILLLSAQGFAASDSFQSGLEDVGREYACPGEVVSYTCTVMEPNSPPIGSSVWRGTAFNCPSLQGVSNEILLRHSLFNTSSGANGTCTNGAITAESVGVVDNCFTSRLMVTASVGLNETTVECTLSGGRVVGTRAILLSGPPSVPTLSCVDLSEDVSGAVNVTVNWTLNGGDSADFYLINITTNAPQTPYGGLLNITNASVTQLELTGLMADYEYNITVRGVNCGSQEGRESEPLTITPQVPAPPSSCNITSLLYNQSSGELLFIDMTWDPMPDSVDPGAACPSPTGSITQYQISFQTGSVVVTENVNITKCTAGRCSHTFEPPSNPPSSYDSVSVAAENVVGVGAARTCTTETIHTTNNLLTIAVIGVSSPTDAQLQCTFLSEFTGSAQCVVQYGTDPTYMNLPFLAETGTAGETVSVVLRERLNSSTVYYYTVSAVSGDITVTVQGTFTTPLYSCNLIELWNLPAAGATFLPDVSLLNDSAQYPSCDAASVGSAVLVNTTLNTATVAYYSGTTASSTACFVCDEGYELNSTTTERDCQPNGLWFGSPIVCVCRQPPQTIPLIVVGAIALVIAIVGTIFTIFHWLSVSYKKEDSKWMFVIITFLLFVIIDISAWWTTLSVIAVILNATGLALCIAAFVVIFNPPDDNACDPSWRSRRDGLTYSAFAVSIFTLIFTANWFGVHFYWQKWKKNMKKWEKVLLLITAIPTGGFSISVIICFVSEETDGEETDGDETDGDETDGHPEKTKKIKSKSRTRPDGSEVKVEMKDVKFAEEQQYSTLQHQPTSPDPLLSQDQTYSKLGEHGEEGGGDEYSQLKHGRDPHAVPNPEDPNYSHFKEGEAARTGYNRVQRGPPTRAVPNPNDPSYSHFPEGASRLPVAAMYAEVGSGVRYSKKK